MLKQNAEGKKVIFAAMMTDRRGSNRMAHSTYSKTKCKR